MGTNAWRLPSGRGLNSLTLRTVVSDPSVVTVQVSRPVQHLPGTLVLCNREDAAGHEGSPAMKSILQ